MIFLTGLYPTSRKLSLLIVWDLSSRSMFVVAASILTNVMYASCSGPKEAAFQKIIPPDVAASWFPVILKLAVSNVQLVPMAPSARLKLSNIPVCGKLEGTGDAVVVAVDVDVFTGVFDSMGVYVLVGVSVGEIANVGVKVLVGVEMGVLVTDGVMVREFVTVGVRVLVGVEMGVLVTDGVMLGEFVTVGVPEEAGALISYILPSMMWGSLLLSTPRSTM